MVMEKSGVTCARQHTIHLAVCCAVLWIGCLFFVWHFCVLFHLAEMKQHTAVSAAVVGLNKPFYVCAVCCVVGIFCHDV